MRHPVHELCTILGDNLHFCSAESLVFVDEGMTFTLMTFALDHYIVLFIKAIIFAKSMKEKLTESLPVCY